MRGKLLEANIQAVAPRNIPAYAGKTAKLTRQTLLSTEHPRVCGENSIYRAQCKYELGTSPRMRGKPGTPGAYGKKHRNIPAYAGKTLTIDSWLE